MFSRIINAQRRSAAWKISLWSSGAFAIGTAIAFLFLHQFLAREIQNHADSWLTGEIEVLADVAARTSAVQERETVLREVEELASREAPRDDAGGEATDRAVLFLQLSPAGALKLYAGAAPGELAARAVAASTVTPAQPADVSIRGFAVPFRVAEAELSNGDRIYLALSSQHEHKVLRRLRAEFAALWLGIIALGSTIVFISTRRMLGRVQTIIETAETIGRSNLRSRVPASGNDDEIARLSSTLNRMLDRVESSVEQLHAMSDALAHDIRSPLTSLRGKLELALLSESSDRAELSIGQSIEELDRLSTLLSTSLDVSEGSVDALRLRKEQLDFQKTLQSLAQLYEPSFAQVGLTLVVHGSGPAWVCADAALVQRTLSNLLDNALKHLSPGATVHLTLEKAADFVRLVVEDDGPGFPPHLLPRIFDRHTKGPNSRGHGLGLAFVLAVVRSHDGTVTARNRPEGGAHIAIQLPLALEQHPVEGEGAAPLHLVS